ncbi:MAG: heterodisulfide reductase-related iron-sulfur binding cluster [Rhodocyclaceae bacterium]|nr:heterodisulfide reductase-related iron-sulfur binding cluster [Rhodocyclaceae bacterium]
MAAPREGNLEAPTRHPLDWNNPVFYDEAALFHEMERVFDICHGCRRCVSLCQAFPTLFDLVDESPTLEVDGVKKDDYWKVVDHCYLCDLCYMTKCPYVPPHEWNVDFPHLMLRAKAVHFKKGTTKLRDKVLTSTDAVGRLAGIPVVAQTVNAVNKVGPARKVLQAVAGIHAEAWLPEFSSRPLRSRLDKLPLDVPGEAAGPTQGKVALFATCYMNRNEPGPGEDFAAVFAHNGIPVTLAEKERCCGMPKLELGDLESVRALPGGQHSGAGEAGRRRLGSRRPRALLRADVQAGTAADVPGRRGRAEGEGCLLRSLRIPDAAPQGRQAEDRLQAGPGQGGLPRRLPPARAEHRPEDEGSAVAGAGHGGGHHRALLRPRRHLRREAGVP